MNIPQGVVSPVTTEAGLTFREISPEKVRELHNQFPDEESFIRELIDYRLIAWPFEQECSAVEKLKLFNRSKTFCWKQIIEANNLIEVVKREELENLLNGVNGTTHLGE